MKKDIKEKVYFLGQDEITKGLVTFTNSIGTVIVAVVMPNDFKKIKSCTIVYENQKG